MQAPLFLNVEEMETLTGFKSSGRQSHWLQIKGWRFELNGNKKPVVARKYAEKMLGCNTPEETAYRPNFAALQGL